MSAVERLAQRVQEQRLTRVLNYSDARQRARRILPKGLFEYIDGGSDDEITLARNRAAFSDVTLKPRMAVRNPDPDLRVKLFDTELSMPILTAPCGGMRLVNPIGDLGVARAASGAGVVHVATSASGYTLEEIAQDEGPKWFQLYRFYNQSAMENLVHRAQQAGYRAIVITVDTTVGGNREADFRNGFSYKMRVDAKNAVKMAPQMALHPHWIYRYARDGMPFVLPNTAQLTRDGKALSLAEMADPVESHSPSWEDIARVRAHWSGPMLIKGLVTVDDARRAVGVGADGIIVSNHGGRQLDGVPATMDVLADIVDDVGSDLDVLLDSGIRRGSDVFKALAVGARAVLVGRAAVWGLAIGGQAGVERMLGILRADLIRTMRLAGCTALHDLDRTWVELPARPPPPRPV